MSCTYESSHSMLAAWSSQTDMDRTIPVFKAEPIALRPPLAANWLVSPNADFCAVQNLGIFSECCHTRGGRITHWSVTES
jgi:hypothetical protein